MLLKYVELNDLGNETGSVQYRLLHESVYVTVHRIGSRE